MGLVGLTPRHRLRLKHEERLQTANRELETMNREPFVVGATGFEPATSCSQSRRSTKLSYAPHFQNEEGHSSNGLAECNRKAPVRSDCASLGTPNVNSRERAQKKDHEKISRKGAKRKSVKSER